MLRGCCVLWCVAITGCGSPPPAKAPPASPSASVPTVSVRAQEVHLAGGQTRVPMQISDNMPLIAVRIDESDARTFVLDTGTTGVIVSASLARATHLPRRSVAPAALRTPGGVRFMPVGRVASLWIGQAEFREMDVGVLNLQSISEIHDRKIGGVIGMALFSDHLLTLDYPSGVMEIATGRLTDGPDTMQMRRGSNGTWDVPVTIGEQTVWCMLDTGLSYGIVLPTDLSRTLPLAAGSFRKSRNSMFTFHGTIPMRTAHASAPIRLGNYIHPDPEIVFIDVDPKEARPMLGGAVLRHFRVTIDQASMRVRFQRPSDTADPSADAAP